MQQWLTTAAHSYPYLVYAVIIFLSIVEGPVIAMLGGLLLRLGALPHFLPLYISLMAGDLIADTLWYEIGRHFGHRFIARFGKYFSITEKGVETVTRIFHKHTNSILIASKLTAGLGFAQVTLITAGIVRIPYRHYILLNFFGQFFWTGFMVAIGYFLGYLYVAVDDALGRLFILGLFVIAAVALVGYGKYVRKHMTAAAEK